MVFEHLAPCNQCKRGKMSNVVSNSNSATHVAEYALRRPHHFAFHGLMLGDQFKPLIRQVNGYKACGLTTSTYALLTAAVNTDLNLQIALRTEVAPPTQRLQTFD